MLRRYMKHLFHTNVDFIKGWFWYLFVSKNIFRSIVHPVKPALVSNFNQLQELLILCFPAGYVFAYNTQPYFIGIGETKEDIAKYMGWIPIVGGSLGVAMGGFISDRLVKGRGVYARVAVVITSLVSIFGLINYCCLKHILNIEWLI